MDYVVIVEKAENSFGAYVPDLPGCVAVAATRRNRALDKDAIRSTGRLQQDGQAIPAPSSSIELVHVEA
ncbi:MAG: type II toxin-antitoxin system HicB family antitoxin [Burkholderiaceae bacterium]|nr:type II toxin-antitoxin system HicB family antitoxin [Burkholderiaceae bacterium]